MIYDPGKDTFEGIILDESLKNDLENISKCVHDSWAREKIAQGWTYGKTISKENKEHPSLVPYEKLTENEKELDRSTAKQVIKALLLLGYKIEK